jgi:hypothetical protein
MDWKIWARKSLVGGAVAGALGIIAYLTTQAEALGHDPTAAAWIALLAPLVLHGLGVLANTIKHWGAPAL